MSPRSDAKARFAAISATSVQASSTPEKQAPADAVRPVRVSVDWYPEDFRRLKALCTEASELSGRASIATSELHRAALRVMLDDPKLRERLMQALGERIGEL